MIRRPHLEMIAKHSVRHNVRGGAGLIAVLATLVLGLVMASIVLSPLEAVDRTMSRHGTSMSELERSQFASQARREVIGIAKKAMGWAMGTSEEQVDYLVSDKPALISAILILIMLITPLCALLGAFNQTSGDIASRGLRFLLIRTERPNIFLGRFIGTVLFSAVVFGVLFAVLGLYLLAKIDVHPKGDMLMWLAGGYLRVIMFSLPYVALCAWISCAIDSPFGALVIALLITYLWPLVILFASKSNEAAGYGQYLTPWGYKWWLFSEKPWLVGVGCVVMAAFSAALLWVGERYFRKRDL